MNRDPKLKEAAESDPGSLMVALMHAARLGLEPGTEQYYLTPRKEKGRLKVLGIPGYTGLVELIYRAGAVASVIVEVVREQDGFSYSPGRDDRPLHDIDWTAPDRGRLVLVYSYAIMQGGAVSKVVVMNAAKISEIKKSSAGSDYPMSPWNTNEEAMWMKSAARQLVKWVPTSAEYREHLLSAASSLGVAPVRDLPPAAVSHDTGEVLEAELIPNSLDDSETIAWPDTATLGGAE